MSTTNRTDIAQRELDLRATIETTLPDFSKACHATDVPAILLHQDAFAADYQEEEYRLLGMAIKFAGIYGKTILINGRNWESVEPAEKTTA